MDNLCFPGGKIALSDCGPVGGWLVVEPQAKELGATWLVSVARKMET